MTTDNPSIPLSAMRAIAVEAIRAVTGCPDIKGNEGRYLVDELEAVARAAAETFAAEDQPQDADTAPAGEPVAFTVAGDVTNWARDFSKYRTQHYVRPVFATPPDHTAVMRQALAALENVSWGRSDEAITALRAALGEVRP